MVQEIDDISRPGLSYCTIVPSTLSKDENGNLVDREEISDPMITSATYKSNTPITVTTEEGYFESDDSITVQSVTATSVTFVVPFGVSNVSYKVKENNAVVTKTIEVEE